MVFRAHIILMIVRYTQIKNVNILNSNTEGAHVTLDGRGKINMYYK